MNPKYLIRVSDGERFVRDDNGEYVMERSLKWREEGHLIHSWTYETLMVRNKGTFVSEEDYLKERSAFPEAIRLMRFRHRLERYLRDRFGTFRITDQRLDDLITELENIEIELYKS